MKKMIGSMVKVVLMIVLSVPAWAGSIEVVTKEGVLTVHEQNGKVIRSIAVSSIEEADKISNELPEEGVKQRQFTDFEYSNPHVNFLDSNGKIIKTMSLKTESEIITKKHGENIIRSRFSTDKRVSLSKDKQYMLLNISKGYVTGIDENGYEVPYTHAVSTDKIEFYDVNGNLLWEKQMPDNVCFGHEKFSDNNEIIYISVGSEKIDYTAQIYNKKGDLLLEVPWGRDPQISPNGKYLALDLPRLTVFYNLHNGKSWNSGKMYGIYTNGLSSGLSNDGIVNVYDPANKTSLVIDLKQYIGD